MKNIKAYDKFNESTENMLFQMATGAIDHRRLKKAKTKNPKEVAEVAAFLNVDPEKILYDPKGFIDKYYYWDGFVIMPLYHELSVKMLEAMQVDKRLEQMRRAVNDALKQKDYHRLFFYYDTKVLIAALITNAENIPDDKLYDCFVFVYTMSEYGFDMIDKKLMDRIYDSRTHSKDRTKRMSRLAKKAKDGKIKVYRGVASKSRGDDSMSWTLSKKVAQFFANRFDSNGEVVEKVVDVDDVMDYLYDRNEEEILLYRV